MIDRMYKKQLFYLVLIASIVRLIAAAMLELGNDEVYYYTYALHLQSNYFDHPPGVAWLIRFFSLNLTFTHEAFIRLGSVVFAAIGTLLSFHIGSFVRNARTGWYAALLYNTSIYSCVIAGTFILPDSPQVVCWLAGLYYSVILVQRTAEGKSISPWTWVMIGVLNGLCIMCKVHGVFLWGGLGLYILLYQRKLLSSPWLYVSALITAAIISPILIWNIQNQFVTWNYHSNRVEVNTFSLDTDSFLQTIFGQLFYNNPLNVIAITIAVIYAGRRVLVQKATQRILLLCGLPIIIMTTGVSLFRSVLPHWSGPGFLSLHFLAAAYFDYTAAGSSKRAGKTHWLLKTATVLITVVMVGGIGLIRLYPGTIGSKDKESYGETDFTLDLYGWRQFGAVYANWYRQREQEGVLQAGTKIVCNKWFPAAHEEYYLARKTNSPVIGLGDINDLHHYAWLNRLRPSLQKGENALCIVPSNYPDNPATTYGKWFASAELLQTFAQTRGGKPCRYFKVYLLKGYKEAVASPVH